MGFVKDFEKLTGKKLLKGPTKPYPDLVLRNGRPTWIMRDPSGKPMPSETVETPGAASVGGGVSRFHEDLNVATAIRTLKINPPVKGGWLTDPMKVDGLHWQTVSYVGGKAHQPENRAHVIKIISHAFQHGIGLDKESAVASAELIIPKSSRERHNYLGEALTHPDVTKVLVPEEKKIEEEGFKNPFGLLYLDPSFIRPVYDKLLVDPDVGKALLNIYNESMKKQGKA
jgi:hypothetical protein